MEIIKSKDNPIVKKTVSLRENRRERTKSGLFVIEGLRLCKDAVLCGAEVKTVLVSEVFLKNHPSDAEIICNCCDDVRVVSEGVSQKLGDTVNSQGVYCICAVKDYNKSLSGNKFIAVENLQDPGNIGTVIRTAEAFGLDGVVLIGNCADIYSPKVLRSTMGSLFRMPVYKFVDVDTANKQFKNAGVSVYGAVLDDSALLLSETQLNSKCVCLIGNEANGLSDSAKAICDKFVIIDMPGNAESLNAAVAASVIMWEMIKR
ncbi:MAG: RNA methyltransferase [Oscillospiraceae bacterium]|nr:RNA methyltransferase [Oscillospiraceae bacterium]